MVATDHVSIGKALLRNLGEHFCGSNISDTMTVLVMFNGGAVIIINQDSASSSWVFTRKSKAMVNTLYVALAIDMERRVAVYFKFSGLHKTSRAFVKVSKRFSVYRAFRVRSTCLKSTRFRRQFRASVFEWIDACFIFNPLPPQICEHRQAQYAIVRRTFGTNIANDVALGDTMRFNDLVEYVFLGRDIYTTEYSHICSPASCRTAQHNRCPKRGYAVIQLKGELDFCPFNKSVGRYQNFRWKTILPTIEYLSRFLVFAGFAEVGLVGIKMGKHTKHRIGVRCAWLSELLVAPTARFIVFTSLFALYIVEDLVEVLYSESPVAI